VRSAKCGMRSREQRPGDSTEMRHENLKQRTQQFALRIIRLGEVLPKRKVSDVIGRQLLRSGTSVGANYRAACRAKSPADFISKMGTVEEETDECLF
jgi:four helix bundle protein